MFKIFSRYLLNKYLKCSIWRLAVRYDPYMGRSAPKGHIFSPIQCGMRLYFKREFHIYVKLHCMIDGNMQH
jgi:hypothetical protein